MSQIILLYKTLSSWNINHVARELSPKIIVLEVSLAVSTREL